MIIINSNYSTNRIDLNIYSQTILIIFCIFENLNSPNHGGSIYLNKNNLIILINSTNFISSKISNTNYYGGAMYIISNSIYLNKICCYLCYSNDNGATIALWDTPISSSIYFSWVLSPNKIFNAAQDSFLSWGSPLNLSYSNSSNNYNWQQASSIGFNSRNFISIIKYCNFNKNEGNSEHGSLILSDPGNNLINCNFLNLKTNSVIISIWSLSIPTSIILNNCCFKNITSTIIYTPSNSNSNLNSCFIDLNLILFTGKNPIINNCTYLINYTINFLELSTKYCNEIQLTSIKFKNNSFEHLFLFQFIFLTVYWPN